MNVYYNSEIKVSILCPTYNHEKYIADTLEGFLKQRTNFAYEILVHDDASTDRTSEIIKEYERKYPHLIKTVLQKENQYSKGKRITDEFLIPQACGKYFALCEGDDFWSSEEKLQKQVDYLEANSDCVACTHNTNIMYVNQKRKCKKLYSEVEKDLKLEDVIEGGGKTYHTSSLMYRSEYAFNKPKFVTAIKSVGDYPMGIYLALMGRIHYFGESMSCYRSGVDGSWSERIPKNKVFWKEYQKQAIEMLKMANEYSNKTYNTLFEQVIQSREFALELFELNFKNLLKLICFKDWSVKQKLKLILDVIR